MSAEHKPHSNPDADLLRAFIGRALTRGVDGYRADDLLGSLARLEEQLEAVRCERDDELLEERQRVCDLEEQLETLREEKSRPFDHWRELHQSALRERDYFKGLLETTQEERDRFGRMLIEIEGGILGYWTDIPEAQLEDWRQRIRLVLSEHEPYPAKRPSDG